MPQDNLHMTALEITHSLTAPEITALVAKLQVSAEKITDYPYTHRARLVKPCVTYDAQALALSFLPAAGEGLVDYGATRTGGDKYSYHHLRRDLYALATRAGVIVASRYVVPSSHLTIGRFIRGEEFLRSDGSIDGTKIEALVKTIEKVNQWLEEEYWPKASEDGIKEGGEWIVGQEKGLDFRAGTLWYGGGETVRLGKGF